MNREIIEMLKGVKNYYLDSLKKKYQNSYKFYIHILKEIISKGVFSHKMGSVDLDHLEIELNFPYNVTNKGCFASFDQEEDLLIDVSYVIKLLHNTGVIKATGMIDGNERSIKVNAKVSGLLNKLHQIEELQKQAEENYFESFVQRRKDQGEN